MSYGHWLDRAAEALRAAQQAATGHQLRHHADAAAAVAARTRVYHALTRLTRLFDNVPIHNPSLTGADRMVATARKRAAADPAVILMTGLHLAAAADPNLPRETAPDHPVAHRLGEAAQALTTAGDIIVSHVGDQKTGPRTLEGRALALGTGRAGALADVARVALQALETDRDLRIWLLRHGAPHTIGALYEATGERMRWWTRGNFDNALRTIAARHIQESVVRLLDVAPATEPSTAPRAVTSLDEIARAIETGRAWFTQNSGAAGLAHIRAAIHLGATVAAAAVRLHTNPSAPDPTVHLRRWTALGTSALNLADLGGPDRPAVVQEMRYAADWLRMQLRDHLERGTTPEDWPHQLRRMTGRLPGLAAALYLAASGTVTRGEMLARPADLYHSSTRGGVFYARTDWQPAHVDNSDVRQFLTQLRNTAIARTGVAADEIHTPGPLIPPLPEHPGAATVDHLRSQASVVSARVGELVQQIQAMREEPARGGEPRADTAAFDAEQQVAGGEADRELD